MCCDAKKIFYVNYHALLFNLWSHGGLISGFGNLAGEEQVQGLLVWLHGWMVRPINQIQEIKGKCVCSFGAPGRACNIYWYRVEI